jgi:hypothetical protein
MNVSSPRPPRSVGCVVGNTHTIRKSPSFGPEWVGERRVIPEQRIGRYDLIADRHQQLYQLVRQPAGPAAQPANTTNLGPVPSGTAYFGFTFKSTGGTTDYGWFSASLNSAGHGTAYTVPGQIAYDNTGAEIALGDHGSPTPASEPASIGLLALGAVVTGAIGTRRLKRRRQAGLTWGRSAVKDTIVRHRRQANMSMATGRFVQSSQVHP